MKISTLSTSVIVLASAPLFTALAEAQTPPPPQFEVATLKALDGPEFMSLRPQRTGDTIRWDAPLIMMLSYSYHLPAWQISGASGNMTFYRITAKMNPSATEDDVRLMLRALLTDRLRIVSHRVTKQVKGYALVVAKGGHKLKTVDSRGEAPPVPDFFRGRQAPEGSLYTSGGSAWGIVVGRGVSISQLTEELSEQLDTFVEDRTGLAGRYYFGFKCHWPKSPSESSEVGSVSTVLPDELGLKLEKQNGPVEMLVIDHFEKPSAN